MSHPSNSQSLLIAIAAAMSFSLPALAQVDVAAAEKIFDDNECTKCHSLDKPKKGPALKKTAAKYKGKPDGEQKIIAHMGKVQKVKLDDGKEADHPIIDTKDPKVIKNVAQWILSR